MSIVVFTALDGPVGACLLVKSRSPRRLLPGRRISVNASGEAARDSTYVEYNNLVCRAGWEQAVALQLAQYLMTQREDEVALDGFVPGPVYDGLKRAFAHLELEETWHPCYYADLRALRKNSSNFETVLGHATRKHLRQNIRRCSEFGRIGLEAATDTQAALDMFDELAQLNIRRWKHRTACPVFSSPRFLAFHRALIGRCIRDKTVELLRVTAGKRTLGILYNLIDEGTVYFYQCGLDYSIDPRLSPGTVTLFHAIQRSLDNGAGIFDFLSGAAPYKQRLSTDSRRLVWAVFRRPGLKTDVIRLAHSVKRRLLERSTSHRDEAG